MLRPTLHPLSSLCNFTSRIQSRNLFCCPLNRSLIEAKGEDTTTFLQSVCAIDVTTITKQKPIHHALFLSPAGRYLADCFIAKNQLIDGACTINNPNNH